MLKLAWKESFVFFASACIGCLKLLMIPQIWSRSAKNYGVGRFQIEIPDCSQSRFFSGTDSKCAKNLCSTGAKNLLSESPRNSSSESAIRPHIISTQLYPLFGICFQISESIFLPNQIPRWRRVQKNVSGGADFLSGFFSCNLDFGGESRL